MCNVYLKKLQRQATKLVESVKDYDERLKILGFMRLDKRRDRSETFKILNGNLTLIPTPDRWGMATALQG